MQFFSISIATAILRFYLMMALVIVPFFLGAPLFALLACPVFLSTILGIKFSLSLDIQTKKSTNTRLEKSVITEEGLLLSN
jgi:hypothetical protein